MADLLIRDLDPAAKEALKARAAANHRSQQKEAKAILEDALGSSGQTWLSVLYEAAQSVGGVELELPERRPSREFSFDE